MADSFSSERERVERLLAEASRHLEELESRTHSEEQQRERILRDVHVEHLTREMVEHLLTASSWENGSPERETYLLRYIGTFESAAPTAK